MNKILNRIILLTILSLSTAAVAQNDKFKYYIAGSESKLQILNQQGKPITDQTYSYVGEFSEGLLAVEKNEKFGFINKKGKVIIPFKFEYADKMIRGAALVKIDGKYGLIDKKGRYKIKPQFDEVYFDNLKHGAITFMKDGFFGLMNTKGKIMIPNKYESIGEIKNGHVVAKSVGKNGLLDTNGNLVIPFQYYYLGDFTNGISLSFKKEENSKMGLMDQNEKVLIDPEYDFIYTSKDLVYLTKKDKKGFADNYGNTLLPPEYRADYQQFNEGLMVLEKDKKFGFTNDKGEIIIPLIYDEAGKFSSGLAPVLKDGKWGFINKEGETVIDFKFVGVMMPFVNGYAPYGKRNYSSGAHYTTDLWGLIDKKGNVVIPNKYYSVSPGYKGNFIVEIDGKNLLINKNEEVITLLKYEERPVNISGN